MEDKGGQMLLQEYREGLLGHPQGGPAQLQGGTRDQLCQQEDSVSKLFLPNCLQEAKEDPLGLSLLQKALAQQPAPSRPQTPTSPRPPTRASLQIPWSPPSTCPPHRTPCRSHRLNLV